MPFSLVKMLRILILRFHAPDLALGVRLNGFLPTSILRALPVDELDCYRVGNLS